MSGNLVTCKEVVEIVTDYFEGAMSAGERVRFEEHLAMCDGCVNYLDQMRKTIDATGSLPEATISDRAMSLLMQTFRDWKNREGADSEERRE